ncbi:MAG: hypothetical protein M1822_003964 [Bathelium mastoideum]|nr:MAG: hypothetical protein M1822_003964 [Bathelium mastoideum]
MCGIYFSIHGSDYLWPDGNLHKLLYARGPDNQSLLTLSGPPAEHKNHEFPFVSALSTVLSLRGDRLVSQPLQDEDAGLVFCWNGEAWKIDDSPISGNDALVIFQLLVAALTQNAVSSVESRQVVTTQVLFSVVGPFSFVLYDKVINRVYYGRDHLGRRSLLQSGSSNGFVLCSLTAPGDDQAWSEVEADGIYIVDLSKHELQVDIEAKPVLIPWPKPNTNNIPLDQHKNDITLKQTMSQGRLNKSLPSSNTPTLSSRSSSVQDVKAKLQRSLHPRVSDIPLPPLDRSEAILMPTSKIALLFSGGLDCTLLARISHDLLPYNECIDLLNVAFENPRIHRDGSASFETCPDRITGRQSSDELRRVCPERTWRFVEINIPYSETLEHRPTIIQLMKPHNTEMDLSIATALYFAARGVGRIQDAGMASKMAYRTPARVLLSGLGADELFAGYQRHATAFARAGVTALLDELELDIDRIGKRNLGRDDRVISHWSREVRYPYLDEALLSWTLSTPVWEKCGFWKLDRAELSRGAEENDLEPGKKLLRLLACDLGMHQVAREKKRAVSFVVEAHNLLTMLIGLDTIRRTDSQDEYQKIQGYRRALTIMQPLVTLSHDFRPSDLHWHDDEEEMGSAISK